MVRKPALLNARGITLTEVMIVTAIISLIGLVTPKLMQQSSEFFLMNRSRLEMQQDSRMIVSHVTRNLRQAIASTIVISQNAGLPPYSMISFQKRNKSPNANAPEGGDLVRYDLRSGGRFFVTVNGVPKLLSSNVQFVAFGFPRMDDMQVISFSLTLQKSIGGGDRKAIHVTSEKIGVMNQ